MEMTANPLTTPVPGRNCDGCGFCCKLFTIEEFKKPAGVWCHNWSSCDKRCGDYDNRPTMCREFNCNYLIDANVRQEWQPTKSRMVLIYDQNGTRVRVHVDPDRPDAWKRQPYYSDLKQWSSMMLQKKGQVVVFVGQHAHVILPDRDMDLGIVTEQDRIALGYFNDPAGRQLGAIKIRPKQAN